MTMTESQNCPPPRKKSGVGVVVLTSLIWIFKLSAPLLVETVTALDLAQSLGELTPILGLNTSSSIYSVTTGVTSFVLSRIILR
ncbi:hypothetical protein RMQ97_01605 [Maricaulis sp. D1M11]|uniref:hypothetical protein n=1 Tax=Maricaulis sp. D1M11 TaxID=3076117 RepID=UPI0039B52DF9